MDLLNAGLSEEMKNNLFYESHREMLWHCRSDPRFSYFAYIPTSSRKDPPPTYRIMSFVHGTGRTTDEYRQLFADFADRHNLIVIYPLFPGGLMDPDDFNSYKQVSYRGVRYDQIFLSMIDEVAQKYPVDTEKIYLYGWSGGGQFVHRFLYAHPERLAAICIGAPGRITYLDDGYDYYLGTRDFAKYFDKQVDIPAIQKIPIMLMVGENDTKFVGNSPYGDNRRERIAMLKKNFEGHGIESTMEIIPGFEHKGNDSAKAQRVMAFFQDILMRQV